MISFFLLQLVLMMAKHWVIFVWPMATFKVVTFVAWIVFPLSFFFFLGSFFSYSFLLHKYNLVENIYVFCLSLCMCVRAFVCERLLCPTLFPSPVSPLYLCMRMYVFLYIYECIFYCLVFLFFFLVFCSFSS